ncbi:MAG: hypothetical protein COA81_11145 [Alphaproteobacteria bacterium]|nr:MAG: hypothetical protein COA81_11145 [Alphaproteobacteria bacterium]
MKFFYAATIMLIMLCTQASATVITTQFTSNNNHTGNMFDLTNISGSAIELTGVFEGNFRGGTSGSIDVWYRTGTYVGNTGSAVGWTLLGSSLYTSLGSNVATGFDLGNSLNVGSGDVIGLYFLSSVRASILYTNGANSYNDGTVQLDLGIGTNEVAFSGVSFSPRTWNGSIEYSAVPEPAPLALLGLGLMGLGLMRKRRG